MISVVTVRGHAAGDLGGVLQAGRQGSADAAKWEPFLTGNLWKTYVLPGVQGTLTAAAVSIVLALMLGFVLGVGRMSTHNGDPLGRVR